jgi:hypothetical protein
MNTQSIPTHLTEYFWGDDLTDLTVNKNPKYIVQTLLDRGNNDALRWLFSTIDKQTIKSFLPTLKLSKKSAHFWNIYLS